MAAGSCMEPSTPIRRLVSQVAGVARWSEHGAGSGTWHGRGRDFATERRWLWPYIVMACMVVSYSVMACMVMACIVVTPIHVACIGMANVVMAHIVMAYIVMVYMVYKVMAYMIAPRRSRPSVRRCWPSPGDCATRPRPSARRLFFCGIGFFLPAVATLEGFRSDEAGPSAFADGRAPRCISF